MAESLAIQKFKLQGETRELSMINNFSRMKFAYDIEQSICIENLMLVGV